MSSTHSWRRTAALAAACAVIALLVPMVAASPAAAFSEAPHREPPQIPHGTYTPRPIRVVSIVPDTGSASHAANSTETRLLFFGFALVRSSWYKALSSDYGLGSVGLSAAVRATAIPDPATNPSVDDIRAFVRQAAHIHHVGKAKSSIETIWNIYFHCTAAGGTVGGHDCGGGFHVDANPSKSTTDPLFNRDDSIGINLLTDANWNDPTLSFATRVASHEIIEGATDPHGDGYRLATNHPSRPWLDAPPWVEVQDSGSTEVGDQGRVFGQQIKIPFTFPPNTAHNFTYVYQRIFADQAAALGGDPAVPASPVPYYDMTSAHNWYSLKAGSQAVATLKGWSVKSEPDWTLTAALLAWTGSSGGSPAPCKAHFQDAKGTHSLTVGIPMNNGRTEKLVVLRTKSAKTGDWCLYEVASARTGKEPGGSGHPDANGDLHHPWMIGVYLTS